MNIEAIMQQAKAMQSQVEAIRATAETKTAEGHAGGDMVKVVANANGYLVAVKLAPDILGEDPELLQDLILLASNQALERAKASLEDEIKEKLGFAAGMLPPGLF